MESMNRKDFLKGMGLAATSMLLGCTEDSGKAPVKKVTEPEGIESVVDSSTLEKPDLVVGFVPVNDCAPFAVAYTKGFFKKYGLRVKLSREASWATSRDGIIFGRLDASPVVSGAVMNARLGAEGAMHAPLCAAMTIHRHGNAITMNRPLWDAGVRPLHEYNGDLEKAGSDIRRFLFSIPESERVFGVVLSSSIYDYFLKNLMATFGLFPKKDYRLIIIPPPQMVTNMRIGALQSYMVAEPWNTRAISGNEGVGFTFSQGSEMWRGHPDRLLCVMESFIDRYPKTYRSLVKAMIEADRWCDAPENRDELSRIISARTFTGAPPKYTAPALTGRYNYGGFDGEDRTVIKKDTTVFFKMPEDVKGDANDHSTFLWQSQALWLMAQSKRWNQIRELPTDAEKIAKSAWRTDLYREIAAELNIPCPASDYKVEPAERFFDRIAFDPSDPTGYLRQFPKIPLAK